MHKDLTFPFVIWTSGWANARPAAYQPNWISKRNAQGLRQNLHHNSLALQSTADWLSDPQDNPNLSKRVRDSRTNSRIGGQVFSPHVGLQTIWHNPRSLVLCLLFWVQSCSFQPSHTMMWDWHRYKFCFLVFHWLFTTSLFFKIKGVYLDNMNIKMSLCISTTPWRQYRGEGTVHPFFASNWMLQSVNTTLYSVRITLHTLAKKWSAIIRPNYKNTKGGICYNCISGWRSQTFTI